MRGSLRNEHDERGKHFLINYMAIRLGEGFQFHIFFFKDRWQ